MEINYHERIINYTDWATLMFVLSVFIIALNRSVFQVRFIEFMRLGVSDKYTKIYKDSTNMNSGFTMSLFLVQLISFSFFVLLSLSHYKLTTKENIIVFIQVITFLGVFILSKYLIEKIIATTFKIEEFVEQFNLLKVSYRTYFGVLLLPINIILYYNSFNENWIYLSLLLILVVINVITYFITLKVYQNIILGKIFYFILYLCTLEIAPYYFIYKWIIKN
ncbi:DUF4271 domain-containing protein [Flavobacterium sp. N2270]|uniref:DUF4271 domain-containing protein n=1 Tax=Flavobacterium sp. N2270 TaxID=2986831 RepID=UPI0022253ECC|nr:DUF4271 domain-containing protein [Flavobacterium sp. N2270]